MQALQMIDVRVYLNNKITNLHLFKTVPGNGYVNHFFGNFEIKQEKCRFYVDTKDGKMPQGLEKFATNYSIHEGIVRHRARPEGIYRNEQFAEAEAETVKFRDRDTDFYMDVVGTNLKDVLGLYWAIINDELLPMSMGGHSATELAARLDGSLAMIADLEAKLQSSIQYGQHLHSQLQTAYNENADLENDSVALQARVSALNGKCDQLEVECGELKNSQPWHKKFGGWFLNIFNAMDETIRHITDGR